MTEFNRNSYKRGENNPLVSLVIGTYVILVGAGLPLFVRDRYFDILIAKYYYYCICTIAMLILLIGCFLKQRINKVNLLGNNLFKTIFANLTLTDCSVLVFYLIAVLSTIASDYVYESFWGNEGRFTGLFLITWYVISYFCVSRLWKFKKFHIDMILIAGILVCLFGITDYFKMDIFNFKAPMVVEQRAIFTSTIGNINTYTAYVGIIAAISTVLFALTKESKRSAFYYFCMIISFFAIIMGVSDNAYLSLAALFSLLPLFLFNSRIGIRKYLIILATFFTVVQSIDWINSFFGDGVLGIDSAFNMVINFWGLHFLVIALWVIIFIWKGVDVRLSRGNKLYSNTFKYIWVSILSVILMAFFYVCYDINILGNSTKYGSLSSYFVFNDNWGTNRGYIWRSAMERFSELSLWKKIIGFGPETFGIFLLQKTANNPYNQLFDSAHNEYLHLLVTVGFAGLISYLLFVISNIWNSCRYRRNNPYTIAVAFGVICYSVQAFVNINLPITTPIFWLLLGMVAAKSFEDTTKTDNN
ncbi:O-antigen ligase family protein [Lacrimispora sp.]|uniref:O-antigen ligase family protein n=1 Tax=Lacrimispora sp. TaxID=2719234 RepID=UPI0028B227D4|nr:O-antigen ligase family protein [Lacrimispora sp.]